MKYPHLTTQNLVFNLQNKLHRYKKFLFRASAATLIEREKREGVKMGTGEGMGRNEIPYIVTCRYLYPSQFLTTVTYVEQ